MIENFMHVVKKYADFKGRARRKEFWYFALVATIGSIILGFIDGIIGIQILSTIFSLALLVPGIAVLVRRMHDVGKDWWYILIPIYNIILAIQEGDVGPNEYGPDPKAAERVL